MRMPQVIRTLVLVALFIGPGAVATHARIQDQAVPPSAIAELVQAFKTDPRGPYRDIRWFCKDGTTVPANERCPTPGVQRARYKESVVALARTNGIHLGQILSTTDQADFWDASRAQSRLKQYQLERYLRAVDDGWILRRAQSYRGAVQVEDEEAWGKAFLEWLVTDNARLKDHYFLIRQAARDIPHGSNDDLALRVRTTALEVSNAVPAFMDLRVKIHGQPEARDAERVEQFRVRNAAALPAGMDARLRQLRADLTTLFDTANLDGIRGLLAVAPTSSPLRRQLATLVASMDATQHPVARVALLSTATRVIRQGLESEPSAPARVAFLDVTNELEVMLMATLASSTPGTLGQEMDRIEMMALAASGLGFIQPWELDEAMAQFEAARTGPHIDLQHLAEYLDTARRVVEWSALTPYATYSHVVEQFSAFEPLAHGFQDEKIRGSLLLPMGAAVGRLGEAVAREAGYSNRMMDIPNQAAARGLNPGFARGRLIVVPGDPETVEIDASAIYVFNRPPADLKPVAGILTVTEGNMVSHVQLLARNLGIPNGVVSLGNLQSLQAFDGSDVFLAVSNAGTLLLKPASDMTSEERTLFEVRQRSDDRIEVPVGHMDLTSRTILDLSAIDASDSGILAGPKAANLGQLKVLFPDHVVEGIVIPFGIFRTHMDQPMPGTDGSYWTYLTASFDEAERMQRQGATEAQTDVFLLDRLATIRAAIVKMPLQAEFRAQLATRFRDVLGGDMGTVPVFLRSDTNMEDLKDFTGAGLNLTLFNVLEAERIVQGIKDVWASPYTERSFRWRQKYLLNPENVYPSILIIPSVNADHSGVVITKGVVGGREDDITVAFNRGVGGAVDGQAAETWLLTSDGTDVLLSPAREPSYTAIPATGGRVRVATTFTDRILPPDHLDALRTMANDVERRMPGTDTGPYDMELGFKDGKIWLFQVRPFVENRAALGTDYLNRLSPAPDASVHVPLSRPMNP